MTTPRKTKPPKDSYKVVIKYDVNITPEEVLRSVVGWDAADQIIKYVKPEEFLGLLSPEVLEASLISGDFTDVDDLTYQVPFVVELTKN